MSDQARYGMARPCPVRCATRVAYRVPTRRLTTTQDGYDKCET